MISRPGQCHQSTFCSPTRINLTKSKFKIITFVPRLLKSFPRDKVEHIFEHFEKHRVTLAGQDRTVAKDRKLLDLRQFRSEASKVSSVKKLDLRVQILLRHRHRESDHEPRLVSRMGARDTSRGYLMLDTRRILFVPLSVRDDIRTFCHQNWRTNGLVTFARSPVDVKFCQLKHWVPACASWMNGYSMLASIFSGLAACIAYNGAALMHHSRRMTAGRWPFPKWSWLCKNHVTVHLSLNTLDMVARMPKANYDWSVTSKVGQGVTYLVFELCEALTDPSQEHDCWLVKLSSEFTEHFRKSFERASVLEISWSAPSVSRLLVHASMSMLSMAKLVAKVTRTKFWDNTFPSFCRCLHPTNAKHPDHVPAHFCFGISAVLPVRMFLPHCLKVHVQMQPFNKIPKNSCRAEILARPIGIFIAFAMDRTLACRYRPSHESVKQS